MNIYINHNNSGSRYYRLIPQLKHMQSLGHKVILEPHDERHIPEHIKWADVVIFQMTLHPGYAKMARNLGKKVIFECDDLIHAVPPTHYSYPETRGLKNRIRWWYRLISMFWHCHGFITTTDNLNKIYGKFFKDRLVFPNYIDIPHWLKDTKKNTTDEIRLLWAGSTSHTGDLQMIKPVLDRILRKYPKVKFIYIGTGGIKSDDLNAKFIYGEDLFEGLPENRESMLSMVGNLWPYTLASLQADIAIAPLDKNYFNKFKSTCKALEYGINGIPGVYSAWHYKDYIINGHNGFLAETEEDWIAALSILIEDETKRREMGENAKEIALKNNINNYIGDWQGFIEQYAVDSNSIKESSKV
jgi:glycosyltransferase involved in cell wall biosynthesis